MIRNPILYDYYVRRNHILLNLVAGLAYAFAFGLSSGLPFHVIFADAAACAILLYIEAVLIWSVYTFSRFESLDTILSISINVVYCVIGVVFFSGVELLVVTLVYPDYLYAFMSLLMPRVFCQVTIYSAFRWYYLCNKPDEAEEMPQCDTSQNDSPDGNSDGHEIIERITVRVGQKIKVIPVAEIIYLKAEDDYVSVVTADGHWLKSETMKEYETMLPHDMFVRVHRSYIVNISKISKIERYGQRQQLQLTCGDTIRISVTGYKVLRERLNL